MTVGFHREQHGMTRIDIDTGIRFEQFIAAFEKAAPPVDPTTLERIVKAGGDWDDVRAAAAENAPNDLMMYAKIDASGFFGVAGHSTQAIEYLVGNHVIAETMFRHDPKAMLYAPLRMHHHRMARDDRHSYGQLSRFLDAARHRAVDVTPIWLMRQAGRSLPEYRKLRERWSLVEIVAQPELCAVRGTGYALDNLDVLKRALMYIR